MAKYILTKQVFPMSGKDSKDIAINSEQILYATPIASDAIELTFVGGDKIKVNISIEDFVQQRL